MAYARWKITDEIVRLCEQQPENPNLSWIITADGKNYLAISSDLIPTPPYKLH